MELTMNSSQTNHMISNGKKNGGGAVIRETFHILTNTLLSLLLPLSFLLLARLATAQYFPSVSNYASQHPTALPCSLFLNKTTTILRLLVSVISASTLAQGLTGKITFLSHSSLARHRLYTAWIFLFVLQLCVGLGIEGSIASGIDGSSFGQEKGLLCRVVFFLGLHETTLFWWRTVVKPVVDDTVFGVYREEEGWLVKVVMGVGFGWLWWWRVREEVEAMALAAEVKRELMMGIGVADFVGWWLYYTTVTIGMVGIVKGLIGVLMFLVCNCRRSENGKPTPNDEKLDLFRGFDCPSAQCKTNRAKGNLIPQLRASKFLKFQEAKLQELAEHVPKGHIPRSMTVHFRGELTRKTTIYVAPGDIVELSGIFLPMPYTGFRARRAGLIADTYLEAMSVTHFKKKYEEYELRGDEEEQIARLSEDGDIYNKLAQSLAPEIFGHGDIKKALLLLLVGAPHRKLKDGMRIRGDLHICLMGDPGVAKSQLLKHIINVAPRGVYTTGKGSSGVGLIAAVQKDPVTNEMVLEGGALVLADMGICAIDEFDKMDESDRTAIHEVMEQQTVSIAKAGITTSLNARTAVLAAANPAWGRYDLRRTPAENINLPPALLSRFDLLWLILDRADMDTDLEMARHVLHVHQAKESPDIGFTPLEPSVLGAYVSAARKLSPAVPKLLEEYIASAYSSIRQEEAKSSTPHSYTTVITLLSILRISGALARLRFSDYVAQSDVDEALRLMQMSKFSLYSDDRQRSGLDAISDIYSI